MTTFNLLPFLLGNSGLGGTPLSSAELAKLQNGSTDSNPVSIGASTSISLDIELFNRYELSEIRYYYTGGTVEISTSQNKDVWTTHIVSSAVGYDYVSDFSGFQDWPRYIRIEHTISSSADVYEVQVKNKPDEQGYWYDGSLDALPVDSNVDAEPSEVQVFNSSGQQRDMYCLIDVESSVDNGSTIEIGASSSGVFYGKYDKGIQANREFSFSSGIFSGTISSGTSVLLDPASGTGYYYSPVFDVSGLDPIRLYWEQTNDPDSDIDWDSEDSSDTIAFRIFNTAPAGVWSSGQAPSSTDPVWGTLSGTLEYVAVPNNTIIEVNAGQYSYIQLGVKFNATVIGTSVFLDNLGLEESLKFTGVPNNGYTTLYARTDVTGYSVGDHANILSFFIE